ncbi:hypothetical protein D3C72_1989100 [compost metagenome]
MSNGEAADLGEFLRALNLRNVPDREKYRRLGKAVHDHVQQAREVGERAAKAEGKDDDTHMLDRRIGKQAFDVATTIQHEGREDQRHQAHGHHQRARRNRPRIGGEQYLEA